MPTKISNKGKISKPFLRLFKVLKTKYKKLHKK